MALDEYYVTVPTVVNPVMHGFKAAHILANRKHQIALVALKVYSALHAKTPKAFIFGVWTRPIDGATETWALDYFDLHPTAGQSLVALNSMMMVYRKAKYRSTLEGEGEDVMKKDESYKLAESVKADLQKRLKADLDAIKMVPTSTDDVTERPTSVGGGFDVRGISIIDGEKKEEQVETPPKANPSDVLKKRKAKWSWTRTR